MSGGLLRHRGGVVWIYGGGNIEISETLYHRDDALLNIAYVMLI